MDRARATEVDGVLTEADVARVIALALRDVGELVFDRRALSERFAPSACADLLAEPLLKRFVLRDGHRSPVAEIGGGALRARRGHRSQTSGSNSTTVPNEKPCACPFGHVTVRSRILSVKADLGNSLPLRDFHGLHTTANDRFSDIPTPIGVLVSDKLPDLISVQEIRSTRAWASFSISVRHVDTASLAALISSRISP